MERKFLRGSSAGRHRTDYLHSAKVKEMNQQEGLALIVPGSDGKGKANFDARPLIETSLPLRGGCKRKEFCDDEVGFDRKRFSCKRVHQDNQRAISWPPWEGPPKSIKGICCSVDCAVGDLGAGVLSKCRLGSGCPRAPFCLYDGQVRSGQIFGLRDAATSIASCDVGDEKRSGGNTSTLTSNEEGDSTPLGFGQIPTMAGETDGPYARYGGEKKNVFNIGRQDRGGNLPSPVRQKWKQKRERQGDCEVISATPKTSGREGELNRVFGVGVWKPHCVTSLEQRRDYSAMNSECSDEAGVEKIRDSNIETGCLHTEPYSTRLEHSNSSREHQSDSDLTDVCLSSGSFSVSREVGSYSSVRPQRRVSFFGDSVTGAPVHRSLDEEASGSPCKKGSELPCVFEEMTSCEGTHPDSKSLPREEMESHENMSVGDVPGNSESEKLAPVFVLSSGRLSKLQEAELGIRPTTIDDDFDEYFAQLML